MNAICSRMNEQSIPVWFALVRGGKRGRSERAEHFVKSGLTTCCFGLFAPFSLFLGLSLLTLPAPAQSTYSSAYTFTTFAGDSGTGSADGAGSMARFNYPIGVAVDIAGNIYVADAMNKTIRTITAAGMVSTIAGFAGSFGSADGTNSDARFGNEYQGAYGLATDNAGNIYVADTSNCTIRKITPIGANWVVSTIAGFAGSSGSSDGTGNSARFDLPFGVATDTAGNLYVADTYNGVIRKVMPIGTNWMVTTIAGLASNYGIADGTNSIARFYQPFGVTVDQSGDVYVADTAGTIRKLTALGTNWIVTTIAGLAGNYGSADGTGTNAQFDVPYGISTDTNGNLYVSDYYNVTVRKLTRVGTNWAVTTIAGLAGNYGSADGTGSGARFHLPSGVAVDIAGNIYVTDSGNSFLTVPGTPNQTIRKITSAGVVSTLAGLVAGGGYADGTGNTARFNQPDGLAVDGAGSIYVADPLNNAIRKISSAGVVSTIAGSLTAGTNDGVGNDAHFYQPEGVAVDAAGNVYVADSGNNTIRKITAAGVVSTIAGQARSWYASETRGCADGTNITARFGDPVGVALDSRGNLYVSDRGYHNIRKLSPVGTNWVVSTLAGAAYITNQQGFTIGGYAEGKGIAARFDHPQGLGVDGEGNIYVADTYNYRIRRISPAGVVNTIAGSSIAGSADGIGGNAHFEDIYGVALDGFGNVYVADTVNSTIRKLTMVGTNWAVSTVAGLAGSTGSADGAGSAARFDYPSGLTVDRAGNVYVADSLNNTIRKGVFTQYTATNPVPYSRPSMSAQLVVTLLPLEAGGQWRFPWDLAWRNSDAVVSNLVGGNYQLEFRNPPGYLAYPPTVSVAVTNGGATQVTNQYYPTLNLLGTTNTGSLTVNIGPGTPSGAGWRFLGETSWRAPGSTASNLLPDAYAIEFEPISGYSKPASEGVQVSAGSTAVVWAGYLLAQSLSGGVNLPVPVPTNSINDLDNYPYGFNGQLQSDVGYGSGVAVQTNVVLTAAHLVFNDQTLSYVNQVYWYFQEEAGVFVPKPQAARGWYVLSGYAAQRTNDVLGSLGPDRSSPQSRNLDVAALYFPSPVAGGGYGGYLPSDAVPNSWLTGTSEKLLVGYPVDGSLLGDSSIVPGAMYQTGPQPYPLSLATDPVAHQQVYTAPWFLSYPGNSGGPLYVQYNGYYYPAGVYLGTLYNGIQPYASLVRGIDSNVVNMITMAQTLGDSGTNSSGGVITFIPNQALSMLNPAFVKVLLGPPEAVQAGAGWRLQGDASYGNAVDYTRMITANGAVIEFKPVTGWTSPTNRAVELSVGTLNVISNVFYVAVHPPIQLKNPRSLTGGGIAMTLQGLTNRVYSIVVSSNLLDRLTNWTEVLRLTNTAGQTVFTNQMPTNVQRYYRAKEL